MTPMQLPLAMLTAPLRAAATLPEPATVIAKGIAKGIVGQRGP
jgi:hypothetical protein